MAAAAITAARQPTNCGSGKLASHRGGHHSCRAAHRFSWLSVVIPKHCVEYTCKFRRLAEQRRIFQRRRFFRWRRIIGRRRCVGELVMDISQEDHERIAKAIHSAEAKTSAEIACVLAKTSSHNTAMPIFIASAAAFAAAWLFMAFTAMTVQRILSLQLVVFLVLVLLLSLPRVRVMLLPRRTRRAIAHHAAMEQFISRGIGRHKT